MPIASRIEVGIYATALVASDLTACPQYLILRSVALQLACHHIGCILRQYWHRPGHNKGH